MERSTTLLTPSIICAIVLFLAVQSSDVSGQVARSEKHEQLIPLQVHGRSRQPRVALVQKCGAQQPQAAGRPFQHFRNDGIGGSLSGQGVQVNWTTAVVGSSCMAKTPEEQDGSSQFISFIVHRPRSGLVWEGKQGLTMRKRNASRGLPWTAVPCSLSLHKSCALY